MMNFTVEEVNLMCIFDTNGRVALITELRNSMPELEDDNMRDIANSALIKLEAISDEDYATLDLIPDYDEIDEVE